MGSMLGQDLVAQLETAVSFVTTGDKFLFAPAEPIEIVRWGVLATANFGGSAVIALDKRITAGSDTGRLDAHGGTLSVGALAEGKGAYGEPTKATDPLGFLPVDPGEELVVEVTTGATTTGTAYAWIAYLPRPFQVGHIANLTKLSA